jgi:hypothetical protein
MANNVTVDNWNGIDTRNTTYLPIAINTGTGATCAYHSVSQQLYYASELSSAYSTTITAITFYYTSGTSFTRKLRVWLKDTDLEDFATPNNTSTPYMVSPGTKVFSGDVELTAGSPYTITFDSPYNWDGTSNIIITVFDSTGIKNNSTNYGESAAQGQTVMFGDEGKVRFLHKTNSAFSDFANSGWTMNNLSAAQANSISVAGRKYVNKITFTFGAAPEPPATPSDLSVSTAITSATLSWSGVLGATSYDLQQSTDGESWSTLSSGETSTSYNWTGLSVASTQYARIRANNAVGSSAWSDAVTVTTDAVHEHDGITFDKWSSTTSLPSEAGNYYLNGDVVLENNYTVPGDINLCLNGHNIYTYAYYITVPSNKTLALYDNVGGGRIYGYYAVELAYSNNGLITIDADGTLVLNGVSVENLANDFNSGEAAYGIYNIGTLKISGAPVISGDGADIYLYDGKVITIESGKPLTNTTPYRILRGNTGDITSGWANMNGANPSDYLTSAPPARGVCLNSATGEARYVRNLRINESNDNHDISDVLYANQLINVSMTRSLTSSQYNTFCLPFALSDAQLQLYFGAGYDLEEFVSSELDGDLLSLTFSKVTALTAGKPYLLQPAVDVANPTFEAVTLGATSPVDQTSDTYISFIGTYAPTELEGGNKNLLFLGADNELFWPASTGNLKGFRAYFEVKDAAQKAAKRARIVQQPGTATGIENQVVNGKCENGKFIKDGQLFIIRDGKTYNILGIECK